MAVWSEWFDLENTASTGHQFFHQVGFHLWRISASYAGKRLRNQRENFWRDAAKYISFRPLDKEHFVRGSARSLGKEYTKERIRERIERNGNERQLSRKRLSARRPIDTRTRNSRTIPDCNSGQQSRIWKSPHKAIMKLVLSPIWSIKLL